MYNNAQFLTEALESLQAQTFHDFAVVMLDDASTDETSTIAGNFAARDLRFIYQRNVVRLGMIETWRRAYSSARALYPSMRYFAWASDHDLWEPLWLDKLLRLLDNHPEAVMAYPLAQRIDASGNLISHNISKGLFNTAECLDQHARFRAITRLRYNFGNMVYGLYRANFLISVGIFRDVLIPDRLLMQELSLEGHILQVEEVLWLRRFKHPLSLKRQVRALWPGDGRPIASYLPWEVQHTFWLIRALLRQNSSNCGLLLKAAMLIEQLRFVTGNLYRRRFDLCCRKSMR